MEKGENNVVQYSGEVSGSYSGSFEMTVNFQESRVKGTFEGKPYQKDYYYRGTDGNLTTNPFQQAGALKKALKNSS